MKSFTEKYSMILGACFDMVKIESESTDDDLVEINAEEFIEMAWWGMKYDSPFDDKEIIMAPIFIPGGGKPTLLIISGRNKFLNARNESTKCTARILNRSLAISSQTPGSPYLQTWDFHKKKDMEGLREEIDCCALFNNQSEFEGLKMMNPDMEEYITMRQEACQDRLRGNIQNALNLERDSEVVFNRILEKTSSDHIHQSTL